LTPQRTLETFYEHFASGDIDSLASLFGADAVFEINGGLRRFEGVGEIRSSQERAIARSQHREVEIINTAQVDDTALAEAVLRGVRTDSGEQFELWFAALVKVQDNAIVRLAEYFQLSNPLPTA
jgi:limonene-1,2-epoxide hydrolase